MLLATQGFVYDGPVGRIGFRPVWQPEDHASFFMAAEGWGLFSQRREAGTQTERIEVRYGKLRAASLVFQIPDGARPAEVAVRLGRETVSSNFTTSGGEVCIQLEEPVVLAKEVLTVAIRFR